MSFNTLILGYIYDVNTAYTTCHAIASVLVDQNDTK